MSKITVPGRRPVPGAPRMPVKPAPKVVSPPHSSPKTPVPRTPMPRITPVIKPGLAVATARGPSLSDVPARKTVAPRPVMKRAY